MPRPTFLREPLPGFLAPMLFSAGASASAPDDRCAIEVKFDGIRAQLRIDGARGWRVRSRPSRDCSAQFPELAGLAEALSVHRAILDGELVHFAGDGAPGPRGAPASPDRELRDPRRARERLPSGHADPLRRI